MRSNLWQIQWDIIIKDKKILFENIVLNDEEIDV